MFRYQKVVLLGPLVNASTDEGQTAYITWYEDRNVGMIYETASGFNIAEWTNNPPCQITHHETLEEAAWALFWSHL